MSNSVFISLDDGSSGGRREAQLYHAWLWNENFLLNSNVQSTFESNYIPYKFTFCELHLHPSRCGLSLGRWLCEFAYFLENMAESPFHLVIVEYLNLHVHVRYDPVVKKFNSVKDAQASSCVDSLKQLISFLC
jgi:hypothetical protein